MKLNKTFVRTSNNFNINELIADISFKEKNFSNLIIEPNEKLKINKSIKSNFSDKIGLDINKYYSLDILVNDTLKNNIYIKYDFTKENDYLIDEIKITLNENTTSNFIILFESKEKCFHNLKLVVDSKPFSKSNISVVNLTSKDSTSLISFESSIESNSVVTHNFIDLGGKLKVSNFYSVLNGENSFSNLNNIYMGVDDRIDMNYYIKCNNKNTKANILSCGTLDNSSYKTFKGTIDFESGCSKSIGKEQENCINLKQSAKSKSLPIILCGEEDVIGTHGVSTGKIDENKMFYLMSKGLSENEAKKVIIMSLFNQILENIPDEKIKNKIIDKINTNL